MTTTLAALNAQAKNLQQALLATVPSATLAFAQELVAQQYGAADWNTLCVLATPKDASSSLAERIPRFSDLPGIPDELVIEEGLHASTYIVESFEEAEVHAADHPAAAGEDDDICVIFGLGDYKNVELTLRELRAAKAQMLGGVANWQLSDGRYLRFRFKTEWAPLVRADVRQEARESLSELLNLCAIGDVDEDTEVHGWGAAIKRAKSVVVKLDVALSQPDATA